MIKDRFLDSIKSRFSMIKFTLLVFTRNISSTLGLAIVLIYVIIALIDQFYPPLLGLTNISKLSLNFTQTLPQPPSYAHPFGTTYPGIDLYHAILKAIRVDIGFSGFVTVGAAFIGVMIGLVSAYYGKWLDTIVMRITDIFFSIPYLVLAIAIGFFLGRSLVILSLALMIIWWPIYARVVRGQVLSIKEYSYIEAARASGVRNIKIMFKHVLPNTLAPVFVQFSFDLAVVVLVIATLDFIGFTPANAYLPELGYLSYIGYEYAVNGYWWTILFPGLAIMIYAMGMNLVGDGLRDALDPRLRR